MEAAAHSPRKRHALDLFAGLPGHYDRMGAILSFGQDPRWRAALVRTVDAAPGARILDVATGTGEPGLTLAAVPARGPSASSTCGWTAAGLPGPSPT